jgi:hypothetical protein
MDNKGYVKNVKVWGEIESWAHLLTKSSYLIPASVDSKIAQVLRKQFSEHVQLLKQTFNAVMALTKSTHTR